MGTVCQKWEASADEIGALQIRTVKIRTGMVLGRNEGFLAQLVPIFKKGLGAALGSGKQYMPWIHINDLCAMYFEAVENGTMHGPYNAAINDNTTNTVFSKTLAKIIGYSLWLPNVPGFLIKLGMGEMAKLVLTGRRVSSEKIEKTGFQFQFRSLETAIRNCL
ncbi:Epimerase family protein [compost metagenome]